VAARWPLIGRAQQLAELRNLLGPGDEQRGVALFGEAGVGKSRLADEIIEERRAAAATVERVRATEAARDIPLGSFSHMLAPGDDAHHRDDLLHLALTRLHQRAGDADHLLVVDDAHLLDDLSVALLHLALTQTPLRVLLTVRTGERTPHGLVALWKDELVARLDVPPLTRDATEELVLAVLGEGVPASLLDHIWRLSRGNALFVRELVMTAVERQASGGSGPVPLAVAGTQQRLRDLVDERLRLIDPRARHALELVAVAEQVPLSAARQLVDPADIEALEQRGLVEVVGAVGAETVQVVHPLYGEVLAANLPRLRRMGLLRELVDAVEGLAGFDRLRLATWRLESGVPGDPEQLLALAGEALARLDHRLAERLAEAAGGTDRADAGLVLSEALAGQGRVDDSEAVLARLRPTEPAQVAAVAVARATNLFLHLDRSGEAYEVLQAADDALAGHPRWQAECRSVRAQMLMFSFRLAEAGEVADALLAAPAVPETVRLRAAPVALTVRGAAGRVDAGLALLDDDLFEAAQRHRRTVPYGSIQLRMARFQGLYWAGRVREIDAFTAGDMGLDLQYRPPSLRGILAGFRGGALLLRGHAGAALAELQRAVRALAEGDWFGQRPLAEAMRARAAVFAGDLEVADEAIAAADIAFAADMQRAARTLPYIELSRAWLLAAQGSISEAADRCLTLATAMEPSAKPLAVEALHAVVRLGRAAEAADALERLAGVVDGPFAPMAARHARALVEADPDQLAAVAAEFEELGADLLAAEVHRSAAAAFRLAGRGVPGTGASRRADELLRRCGDPSSPGLEPAVPMGDGLTEREREVAVLASRGRTSREIARTLDLSVRTVDTHLSRIYRKLMIEGRHELAEALRTSGTPGHLRSDY
jgi:DNA-binding CsgD family transcriptional regulator